MGLNRHMKYYNNQRIQVRDLHDLLVSRLNFSSLSSVSGRESKNSLALHCALKENLVPWVFCEFLLYIYPEQASKEVLSKDVLKENYHLPVLYVGSDSQKFYYGTCHNCGYSCSRQFYEFKNYKNCEECYLRSRKVRFAYCDYTCETEKIQFVYLLLRENPFICSV